MDQSIASLLGAESGHVRPQVRAYATGLFRAERWTAAEHARELVLEAEGYAAAGYNAMKLKTGFGLHADVRHTAAIRQAIGPSIAFYVDSNAAYTPQQSIALGEAIADYDVGWMEEPTGPTRLGRLPSGPRGTRRASPRPSPSPAENSSAPPATSLPAATPRPGTSFSPTLFQPAVSPACGAWAS